MSEFCPESIAVVAPVGRKDLAEYLLFPNPAMQIPSSIMLAMVLAWRV